MCESCVQRETEVFSEGDFSDDLVLDAGGDCRGLEESGEAEQLAFSGVDWEVYILGPCGDDVSCAL